MKKESVIQELISLWNYGIEMKCWVQHKSAGQSVYNVCVEREVAQIWVYAKASFKPNQMCVSPGILSSSQ